MTAGHLAVIDMQRVFADPVSPWATPRYADAVAGVRSLLPAFADRVTFTRFQAPREPTGAWRAYYAQWAFALQPPDSELWQLSEEFAELAGHVVTATTLGKWTPQLAARVGPGERLVLAGVSTDCCVLSTALAAADAGTEVLVVADACAGVDDDSHLKALQIMELYRPLIRVTTVDDLLAEPGP
ncbi:MULTISPECIES: cysteine hydrolase family protein [Streptomyces]|uniref:cysteine hydrolase family protein n=1 Tax=Streptomyces TaxID=1883 RepID=UPI0004CD80E4|nr:cysteine hydrolase [Streptomyces durhamensis]